jgi:hypothetical protein
MWLGVLRDIAARRLRVREIPGTMFIAADCLGIRCKGGSDGVKWQKNRNSGYPRL